MTSRINNNSGTSNEARFVHVHLDPSSNPNGSHQVITFPEAITVGDFKSLDTALIDIATFIECDPQHYLALPGKNVLTKPTDMLTRGKHYIARFYENENDMMNTSNNSSSNASTTSSSKKSVAFHPHATIREYSISLIHNSNSMSLSPATNNNNNNNNSSTDSFGVVFNPPSLISSQHHLSNQMLPAGAALLPNLQKNNIMPLQTQQQQQAKSFQFPIAYEYNGQQFYVQDGSDVERLLSAKNNYVTCKTKQDLDAEFERLIIGGGRENNNINNNNNNNNNANHAQSNRENNFVPRESMFIP